MKPFSDTQLKLIAKLPPNIQVLGKQRSRDELWILALAWYDWSNPDNPPLPARKEVEIVNVFYNGEPDISVYKGKLLKYEEKPGDFVIDSLMVSADGFPIYIQWGKRVVFNKTENLVLPNVLHIPALLLTEVINLKNSDVNK